ncbi:MAG: hypothetical protein LBR93_08480 [Treponema sp.]|jgi:hypothetical protein|nr:hypothetical protein [Treponema sp.]
MLTKALLKKAFVVLFALALLAGVNAGGGSDGGSQGTASSGPVLKPVKIAVAFWLLDANALLIQKYLQEYVGPAFNVSFMFSEAVEDSSLLMTFMENAYAAGCQGIINYQNTAISQAIAKANDLGMYIVSQTTASAENSSLPYNMGFVAATAASVAQSYGELMKDLVNDGRNHNSIIVSAGAGFGNAEHYEVAMAILRTLEGVYGLKYEKAVKDLAASRGITDVTNDKGIKITIYPGYPTGSTYVTGLSTLLQTGEYDTVLACNAAYARCSVAIDEVEKARKMNIRVLATSMMDDQMKTSFSTVDSTGDSSLNSAVITASISQAAGLFSLVYNGITGFADKVRVNGEGVYFNTPKWKCKSAADFARLEQINSSNDTWEVTIDEIKQLLVLFNPNANAESIYRQLDSITSESVLRARGP